MKNGLGQAKKRTDYHADIRHLLVQVNNHSASASPPPQAERLSFRDIDLVTRQKAVKESLVQQEMISKLPPNIACEFVRGFLQPNERSHEMLQLFFSLEGTSIITSNIINHKSSSHKALDPLYNKLPIRLVDQYFYSSPAGDAIPDRLKAVIGNLPAWIREAGKGKKKIDVVVPGSGPARDIINILSQNSDLRQRVKAYCIDNEPSAIELGMYLAKNAGVADNIQYIEEDFMKANLANMDLALLVGIICPLSNSISAKVINKVKSFCRDGGLIVFSAALQKMLFHDPVTCFVMDFIDWKLHYKSQQDLRLILKNTKLIEIGSFLDPKYQFHQIIIGRTR